MIKYETKMVYIYLNMRYRIPKNNPIKLKQITPKIMVIQNDPHNCKFFIVLISFILIFIISLVLNLDESIQRKEFQALISR